MPIHGDFDLNSTTDNSTLGSSGSSSSSSQTDFKLGCEAATTANLNATYVNGNNMGVGATLKNNGTNAAFTIDNITLAKNDRVLIKDQTAKLQTVSILLLI